MATWKEQLKPIGDLRSQREQLDQQVYLNNLQIQQKQKELLQAMQQNAGDLAALQQAIDALQNRQTADKKNLEDITAALNSAMNNLYGGLGPQQLVEQLSDEIPIALLPVRLETRFNTDAKQPELWLRIYPDDIAVYTHEKTLTDSEVAAGKNYWIALFNASKAGSEDQKKTAWTDLVTAFGAARAAWVASQTKPTNWSDDLSGIAKASQLVFPVFDVTKPEAWSRAPRTKMLPDKFVVSLYTGGIKVKEITGNLVPDELIVGPDPQDAEGSFVTSGNDLQFGPEFDWTSDFEKAVAVGMGIKIPLSSQEATNGFDTLLVLGLNVSSDETASQQGLQDLIDNHHYAPQGFGLVTQGSPTNNTDTAGSGFSQKDPFNDISYFVETGDPLFSATDDCDGKNLADALGIDYAPLQFIENSHAQDNREAVLMNKALYAGTLGYYVNTLLSPVVSTAAQPWLEDFFTRWVTGRGPLPAFRVGNQPYAVLLTSNFSTWQWQKQESQYPVAFLQTLYNVLNDYSQIWKSLLPQLMYAGVPGQDPSAVLLNILGLQPGSASFAQRNAYSTEDLYNRDAFEYGGRYYADLQNSFTSKSQGLNWLQSLGFNLVDAHGALRIPQILRLVYQHYTTALDATNLIDGLPLSESDALPDYDTADHKNYLDWLAETATVTDLEQQNFGTDVQPPNALLYLMLRKALLQSLHAGSVHWFGENNTDFTQTVGAINFHNIRPEGTLTKWEVMKAPLSVAVPGHVQANMAVADYLLGPGVAEPAALDTAAIRSALAELAEKPTARLARCFTDHLDSLTYRLDSWQTALFTLRLRQMRTAPAATNNQETRRQGIYLGSFGWLENIRPSARTWVPAENIPAQLQSSDQGPVYSYANNGGYVHAPSINHASAAAILRSGYLSHATVGSPDAMSVNLSSERVRRAVLILEGMRQGQQIEALLGYQFERGLHDRASADNSLLKLNEYIYDFRDKYPIARTLVQQQGTGVQETIPATDVVNGLLLSQTASAFPYGATGAVTSASDPEIAAMKAEKGKLDDSLDAVKDLLTVESIYQLVLGNFDRAGAVVNALQDGSVPPELDSIDTPKATQLRFTNRVVIQFANADPALASTNPWTPVPMTARAKMETGINQWLSTLLGPASGLVVEVAQQDSQGHLTGTLDITIDQLGIQPIDLLYMVGTDLSTGAAQPEKENKTGASELEQRIAYCYRKAAGIDDSIQLNISFLKPQGIAGKRAFGELLPLIRTLKTMITDSRFLQAQDFDQPQTITADKTNPKALDTTELLTRVTQIKTADAQLLQTLQNISIDAQVTDGLGSTTVYDNLGETFMALDSLKKSFSDIIWTLDTPNAGILQNILLLTANAAAGNAFPQVSAYASDGSKGILLEQARSIAQYLATIDQQAGKLITLAATLTDKSKIAETLISAGKGLLGSEFNILPLFSYHNESDILRSDADRTQLLDYASAQLNMIFPADEWMQNAAHARPRLARWDYIRTLTETVNISLPIKPVQLPYKAKDSWLAVEFPENDPLDPTKPFDISQDTLSVAIHGDHAFAPGTSHCGLVVDDWTETIPMKQQITGISFNYDRPSACPPQTILLAVPAAVTGKWTWDGLLGILNDTLLRAKLRAVEPQLLASVNKAQSSVMLPALLSNFTQFDLDISLDYRMNLGYVVDHLPTTSVSASV